MQRQLIVLITIVLIHIKILVVFASYPESLYTKTQSF